MIALIDLNRDTTWAPASSRPGTGGVHSQAQQQDLAYSRWTDAQRIAYHPRQAGRYCGSVTVGNCRPPRLASRWRRKRGPVWRVGRDHLCGYAMDFDGITRALDCGFGCPAATFVALRQPRLSSTRPLEAIETSVEVCTGSTIIYQPFGVDLSADERLWLDDFERRLKAQPGRYQRL